MTDEPITEELTPWMRLRLPWGIPQIPDFGPCEIWTEATGWTKEYDRVSLGASIQAAEYAISIICYHFSFLRDGSKTQFVAATVDRTAPGTFIWRDADGLSLFGIRALPGSVYYNQ